MSSYRIIRYFRKARAQIILWGYARWLKPTYQTCSYKISTPFPLMRLIWGHGYLIYLKYSDSIALDKMLFFSNSKLLIFFLFLHKNICCGYSLEAPRWGASNEYHNICFHPEIKHMFLWRNKKNIYLIFLLSRSMNRQENNAYPDQASQNTLISSTLFATHPSKFLNTTGWRGSNFRRNMLRS